MPDSNTTRYGLIGCGMMGQEHLRNIALLPGVEAAVIFDPIESSSGNAIVAPRPRRNVRLGRVWLNVLMNPTLSAFETACF